MNPYKYIFQKYINNSKQTCPACGKPKVFTRYVDIETNEVLAHNVGRCDREDKCGYHYPPRQYFTDNGHKQYTIPKAYKKTMATKQILPTYIDPAIVESSFKHFNNNHFITYLNTLFGAEITNTLLKTYPIGTSKYWQGATVFWQVDSRGNVRTGKIMLYNPIMGKRVKEPYNHITWAHSVLKQPNFTLKQCLFGEHLITQYPNKPIAIVESEKAAIIASVYMPNYNWLATGGAKNLNKERFSPLQGKKIVLFPDVNQYDKWKQTAENILLPNTHISVSDYLEKNATPQMREHGADLADILIKPDPVAGWALTDYDYPVMWN
jgi:hypothetical protein